MTKAKAPKAGKAVKEKPAKEKTKAGKLIQNLLRIVEGKGYHSLIISIEDGKIKIQRFHPGEGIKDVGLLDADTHAIAIDSTHFMQLANPSGIPEDRLESLIVDMSKEAEETE